MERETQKRNLQVPLPILVQPQGPGAARGRCGRFSLLAIGLNPHRSFLRCVISPLKGREAEALGLGDPLQVFFCP